MSNPSSTADAAGAGVDAVGEQIDVVNGAWNAANDDLAELDEVVEMACGTRDLTDEFATPDAAKAEAEKRLVAMSTAAAEIGTQIAATRQALQGGAPQEEPRPAARPGRGEG